MNEILKFVLKSINMFNCIIGSRTTSHTWKRFQYNRVKTFVRSFQWFHIPVSLVLAFIALQQFRRIKRREESKRCEQKNAIKPVYIASDIEVSFDSLSLSPTF